MTGREQWNQEQREIEEDRRMGEVLDHAYALEWRILEIDPDAAALADAAMTLRGRWGDAAASSEERYSAFEYGTRPTGSHAFLVGLDLLTTQVTLAGRRPSAARSSPDWHIVQV